MKAVVMDLVERFDLPGRATGQLTALVEILAGDPEAPTTVTDPAAIVRDHLADALVALDLSIVRQARLILDLGSGAGVPGLPLAVGLPAAHVVLLDSSRRKCEFMRRAVAACGVSNAEVLHERAELAAAMRETFDLVTARAVAPLPVVAEYAAPLLKVGGHLVAWRGRREPEVEAEAAAAAPVLGLEPAPPVQVHPYPEAAQRHLHVMSKVSPTPGRFPRRAGVARRRPLGSAAPSSDRAPR